MKIGNNILFAFLYRYFKILAFLFVSGLFFIYRKLAIIFHLLIFVYGNMKKFIILYSFVFYAEIS